MAEAKNTPKPAVKQVDKPESVKERKYVCFCRCFFNGQYWYEDDVLVDKTGLEVPANCFTEVK